MPPPYLFISLTALLLTPGTRKRPPQSGSVQTGMWEITPKKSASSAGSEEIPTDPVPARFDH